MAPPFVLAGIGSDDEEEGESAAAPPGLPGLPPALTGLADLDASFAADAPPSESMSKTGFLLSQSGAFKTADFQIRKEGGLVAIGEEAGADEHAHPEEMGFANDSMQALEVHSIADLEMLNELGSGASGTVFKARHVSTGTIVAVKSVTILEKAKRDQVVSELRIMRKHTLGARWLVGMHNAFYEDAKVFTVLEMMDGGSVEDLVRKHAQAGGLTDERENARIGRGILEGLNYLHRQLHQVHRDLKPANVMLNTAGDVKIADFGISSQLANTAAFCETFVGTTCYMSPERLSGEAYSYTADVWAFGLILLELATGKYPYPKPNSYFELLGSIMDKPPPRLPETFSSAFADFLALCLDKTPNLRPSAKDLLKHPWLKQPPSLDRTASGSSSRGESSSRHDRNHESPPLERSRSNLSAQLDISGPLAAMSLGASE